MRKGEISARAIDRDWPYQVSLPAATVVRDFNAIEVLRGQLSAAPRGHAYRLDDVDFVVTCFAVQEHAEIFAATFDGTVIAPGDRPPWRAKGSRHG